MRERVARPRQAVLPGRVAHRQSFGIDELDVSDAEEAEEGAHVCGFAVERGAGIESAARRKNDRALARQQADRPLLGVAEGLSGTGDVVEVSLERRRNPEVVHREADDDDIGLT